MAQRRRKHGQRRARQAAAPARPVEPAVPPVEPALTPAEPALSPADPAAGRSSGAGRSRGGWRAEPDLTRSQRRDAQVRAGLTPIESGERPRAIVVGALIAGVVGLGNLIAFAAGVKVGGKHPSAGGVVVFSVLMIVCAVGMWRLWYGAVLGFMALLAIIVTIFALLLIEASNLLGLVVALAVILGAGYLFYKLVRVLSRIQMPRYPGR
ncbi:MAG TPA: hypothetical protein VGH45_04265 [Solirubrobacteraceae bacterium]